MFRKIANKIKKSYFVVNKIYLFILFIFLLGINATIAFSGIVVVFLLLLFTRKVPLEPKEYYRYDTHVYKHANDHELKLDIWYPNQYSDFYPVVFFAHGGGWISGFRNQPNNVSWSKYLASKGFAVVSIDYRYGINNSMEEILSDYSDALIYVKKYGKELSLNTDNMALMGLSAGGHLSLLYASYYTFCGSKEKMSGIKGIVAFYSPSDLKDIFEKDNKSLFARFATMATLKGLPNEKGDVYDYYSPINWISKRMLPTFIAHGKMDNVVPFISSVKLAQKLKKYDILYKFFVHKRGGHTFEFILKDFQTVRILENTSNFLKGLLKNESRFQIHKREN